MKQNEKFKKSIAMFLIKEFAMKKFICLFVAFLLLSLSACSVRGTAKYDVFLEYPIETAALISGRPTLLPTPEGQKEMRITPVETSVQLGSQQVSVNQIGYVDKHGVQIADIYQTLDGNIRYTVYTAFSGICIRTYNSAIVKEFTGEAVTEGAVLDAAKAYLDSIFDGIDYNGYTYSVQSRFFNEAGNLENVDTFYVENQGDKTRVKEYVFSFQRRLGSVKTEDEIVFKCNENGDLIYLSYASPDVDWTKVAYDKKDVNASVEKYLVNYSANKSFDFEFRESHIIVYNGYVYLCGTLRLTQESTEELPLSVQICSVNADTSD